MIIRVLVATLVGGIVNFFLGWLLFGILLAGYFKAHMIHYPGLEKDPPEMIPLVLFNFVYAWLFAFIFDYWARIRTFAAGLKGGALIMLPLVLAANLQYKAFMNLHTGYAPILVDMLVAAVMGAIMGGVIGFVLGKMDKSSPALD
ncbi:MAG TPA: hypothetical protein VK400_04270 [Pyrinomonadaceae bacterium]|nr:hypothetical protein [Pyrinomonadaceae bacterium]